MRELRLQLDQANADYRALRYPGDLAMDLLGAARPPRARWQWWALPAVAALLAVALWPRHPSAPSEPPRLVAVNPAHVTTATSPPTLRDLRGIEYAIYISQVRDGMQEAIGQLSTGVDTVREAPIVTGSLATVRHVAGELQEFASVTWSQIKPRRSPGC